MGIKHSMGLCHDCRLFSLLTPLLFVLLFFVIFFFWMLNHHLWKADIFVNLCRIGAQRQCREAEKPTPKFFKYLRMQKFTAASAGLQSK